MDTLLLQIIADFLKKLKSIYMYADFSDEALIYEQVTSLSVNLVNQIKEKAPTIISEELKTLTVKYLDLPLKYDRAVIDNIYSQYSIFKNYNPSNYARAEITRMKNVILQGTYNKITDKELRDNLIKTLDMSKKRALLLARAEKQSIDSSAKHIFYKNKEVLNQYNLIWDSTIDGATRPDHREMNGAKANLNGLFTTPWGVISGPESIPYPSRYNCRCKLRLSKK